jgi:hypothetical protein
MKKRYGSIWHSEGTVLAAISIAALVVAAIVTLSFDTGSADVPGDSSSQVAVE